MSAAAVQSVSGLPLADVLDQAAAQFVAARIADGRRESLTLWAAVAGVSPGTAWLERDAPPAPALVERYRQAVRQRAAGTPVAYAAGTASFRALELMVDERVLIPRPETEGLVERVLRAFARSAKPGTGEAWGTAADIGTGSGAIALSLAVEGRFGRLIASDCSADALRVARENADRSVGPSRIDFRLGSLLDPLAGETIDVLVSNPPYVTAAEWEGLDPGVRDHEPRTALVGGGNGMEHITALLRDGVTVVRPGGLIALEVDCRRSGAALVLARQYGWVDARVERDLFGRERYLLATREPE